VNVSYLVFYYSKKAKRSLTAEGHHADSFTFNKRKPKQCFLISVLTLS